MPIDTHATPTPAPNPLSTGNAGDWVQKLLANFTGTTNGTNPTVRDGVPGWGAIAGTGIMAAVGSLIGGVPGLLIGAGGGFLLGGVFNELAKIIMGWLGFEQPRGIAAELPPPGAQADAVRRGRDLALEQPADDPHITEHPPTPNLERFDFAGMRRIATDGRSFARALRERYAAAAAITNPEARNNAIEELFGERREANQLLANAQLWDQRITEWNTQRRPGLIAAYNTARVAFGLPEQSADDIIPEGPSGCVRRGIGSELACYGASRMRGGDVSCLTLGEASKLVTDADRTRFEEAHRTPQAQMHFVEQQLHQEIQRMTPGSKTNGATPIDFDNCMIGGALGIPGASSLGQWGTNTLQPLHSLRDLAVDAALEHDNSIVTLQLLGVPLDTYYQNVFGRVTPNEERNISESCGNSNDCANRLRHILTLNSTDRLANLEYARTFCEQALKYSYLSENSDDPKQRKARQEFLKIRRYIQLLTLQARIPLGRDAMMVNLQEFADEMTGDPRQPNSQGAFQHWIERAEALEQNVERMNLALRSLKDANIVIRTRRQEGDNHVLTLVDTSDKDNPRTYTLIGQAAGDQIRITHRWEGQFEPSRITDANRVTEGSNATIANIFSDASMLSTANLGAALRGVLNNAQRRTAERIALLDRGVMNPATGGGGRWGEGMANIAGAIAQANDRNDFLNIRDTQTNKQYKLIGRFDGDRLIVLAVQDKQTDVTTDFGTRQTINVATGEGVNELMAEIGRIRTARREAGEPVASVSPPPSAPGIPLEVLAQVNSERPAAPFPTANVDYAPPHALAAAATSPINCGSIAPAA